jgi:hypothetical protein
MVNPRAIQLLDAALNGIHVSVFSMFGMYGRQVFQRRDK